MKKKPNKVQGKSVPPRPGDLPPCRVCGNMATGFHYGANTCGACKAFFSRSQSRCDTYTCSSGTDDCSVQFRSRVVCCSCRYRKCLAVGMSRDGIRTGRYTHATRAKNIREIVACKQLKQFEPPRQIKNDAAHSPWDNVPQENGHNYYYDRTGPIEKDRHAQMQLISDDSNMMPANISGSSPPVGQHPEDNRVSPLTPGYAVPLNYYSNTDNRLIANDSRHIISSRTSEWFSNERPNYAHHMSRELYNYHPEQSHSAYPPAESTLPRKIAKGTHFNNHHEGEWCMPPPLMSCSDSEETYIDLNNEANILRETEYFPPSPAIRSINDTVHFTDLDRQNQACQHRDTIDIPNPISSVATYCPLSSGAMDLLIEKVVGAHHRYSSVREAFEHPSLLVKQQRKFVEKRKSLENVFGDLRPLSQEEHRAFHHATGIDPDDRDQFLDYLFDTWEVEAKKLVQFAKCIPEFTTLSIRDQATLLKASCYECSLLENYRGVNYDMQVIFKADGTFYQFKDLEFMTDMEFESNLQKYIQSLSSMKLATAEIAMLLAIVIMFRASCYECSVLEYYRGVNYEMEVTFKADGTFYQLKDRQFMTDMEFESALRRFNQSLFSMKLTTEEIAMLLAIVITFRDRAPLEEPEKAERIQLNLLQSFRYLLRKNHSDSCEFFYKVWNKLISVRTLTELNSKRVIPYLFSLPKSDRFPLAFEFMASHVPHP